ncbi:MAG: riboflavin synthase [Persephonella sp.]|nr:MAG: riboflavin synthase [Persephonella sp.]
MFTGLIEEVGRVKDITIRNKSLRIKIEAKKIAEDVKEGDSIAINGTCLTVVDLYEDGFSFDVSEETLNRTNIKYLKIGHYVNLERALRVSDRLGGHIVQGHIDTTSVITGLIPYGEHTILKIKLPNEYRKFVIEKGSIAIDGISLTINKIENNEIFINIIPHTLKNTNLQYRKVGDIVNLEFDILGKYVLQYIEGLKNSKNSYLEKLLSNF